MRVEIFIGYWQLAPLHIFGHFVANITKSISELDFSQENLIHRIHFKKYKNRIKFD